jgi:hypothetical protein
MAMQIADYRIGQHIPSECEVVRRLIELGLTAAQQSIKEV